MRKMRLDVFEYIAQRSPKQSVMLLRGNGCTREFRYSSDIAKALRDMEMKKGDDFTRALVEIHPDIKVFEKHFSKKTVEQLAAEKTSFEQLLKAEGEAIKQTFLKSTTPAPAILKQERAYDVLLGVGLAVGTVGIIFAAINVAKK